jgi:hypothetical protein
MKILIIPRWRICSLTVFELQTLQRDVKGNFEDGKTLVGSLFGINISVLDMLR